MDNLRGVVTVPETVTMRYNSKQKIWFCGPDLPADVAGEIGLNWSRTGNVWCTDNHYAALALWDAADDKAKDSLFLDRLEYEASWAEDWTARRLTMPPDQELYPFQRAGVAYALAREHGTLIGDQPGLGKTAQAIVYANELQAKSVVVVCPAAVRMQWRDMIRTWAWPRTTKLKGHYVYDGLVIDMLLSSKNGVHPAANWTIVSYDLIARVPAIHRALMDRRYDLLVIDEAHYLKSFDALRTRAVFGSAEVEGLSAVAERTLALTGTPLPNRPRECYTVTRALCWDAIDRVSEDRFKHRFNPALRVGRTTLEEVGRLPELHNRLRCNFMVRRLKTDVLKQLPSVLYELTYTEENADIKRVLHAEKMLDIDPLNLKEGDAQINGQISEVRRLMGEAKIPLIEEHCTRLLDGGLDKLVVFCWHRSVIDALMSRLEKYNPVKVAGGDTAVGRHRRVNQFIKDPSTRVILANIVAAGTGLDGLQKVCSHVVFAEASWVPGQNDQAVDRLWRMGQGSSVFAQFLVAPNSFDERVLGSAIGKARDIDGVLDRRGT